MAKRTIVVCEYLIQSKDFGSNPSLPMVSLQWVEMAIQQLQLIQRSISLGDGQGKVLQRQVISMCLISINKDGLSTMPRVLHPDLATCIQQMRIRIKSMCSEVVMAVTISMTCMNSTQKLCTGRKQTTKAIHHHLVQIIHRQLLSKTSIYLEDGMGPRDLTIYTVLAQTTLYGSRLQLREIVPCQGLV